MEQAKLVAQEVLPLWRRITNFPLVTMVVAIGDRVSDRCRHADRQSISARSAR